MLPINKNLTAINYTKGNKRTVKYIVIHYTANDGDTAKNNTDYFKNINRNASAHYFVDESSIWQCVEDHNVAWHCGTSGTYYHPLCRNSNSIGIELCSRKYSNGEYYFKPETVTNAIELVKFLMKEYKISIDNVIRHKDVTGKICPAPFVNHQDQWDSFKSRLTQTPIKDLYRVAEAYMDGKYINQKGAFSILDNAKACCDANTNTQVFNSNGEKIYPNEFKPYLVEITTDVLRVRQKPTTLSSVVTKVQKGEVFTIIEEHGKWGRLLSKVGYIHLDYTRKI